RCRIHQRFITVEHCFQRDHKQLTQGRLQEKACQQGGQRNAKLTRRQLRGQRLERLEYRLCSFIAVVYHALHGRHVEGNERKLDGDEEPITQNQQHTDCEQEPFHCHLDHQPAGAQRLETVVCSATRRLHFIRRSVAIRSEVRASSTSVIV